MKKLKLRFSYFLILGFLGIIFQMISFFNWTNFSVTQADLITTSESKYYVFEEFIKPNYFIIIAGLLLIAFAIGILLASKKEQVFFRTGAYTIILSQAVIIIVSIIYLIYITSNRENMFKVTEEFNIAQTLDVIVNIKYIGLILSAAGLVVTSLGYVTQEKDKIARVGGYIGMVSNGILLVSLLMVLISGMFTQSYDITNSFISISQKLAEPYELTHRYMNGFTLGHLNRVFMLSEEIATHYKPENFIALNTSVGLSLVVLLANVVAIVGNMFAFALEIIQSFDLSKDETPMEM